jgi:hypothetical protein
MEANTHEILIINLARRVTHARASVIPVSLASSVIWVVTQSWGPGSAHIDEA